MIKKVKGTIDYNGIQWNRKQYLQDMFVKTTFGLGFKMIETPILEYSELFRRSNEQSEMVKKEMFEFPDKGNRELVLRPEGTASFVRSFVDNKWYAQNIIQQFAYFGPMFRYERPQAGRFRQFYQAGVEYVGDKNPYKDGLVIHTAYLFLEEIEVAQKGIRIVINSIGDAQSRENYQKALKEFLEPYRNELTELSRERLDSKNVLRILDDKVDSKLPFMQNAPKISDYLSEESKIYFQRVQHILDVYNIDYEVNENLVRGLDYYDETVFEILFGEKEPITLIGGGRYSNLIEELGGPKISSVGFGIGIDRLLDLFPDLWIPEKGVIEAPNFGIVPELDILFAASDDEKKLDLLLEFKNGIDQYLGTLNNKFVPELIKQKKIMEMARREKAKILIYEDPKVIGPNSLVLKDLRSGQKTIFDVEELEEMEKLFAYISDLLEDSYEENF